MTDETPDTIDTDEAPVEEAPVRKPQATPAGKYPKQVVLMISTDVYNRITTIAEREELKRTEVLRALLHAGLRKAGHTDIIPADKREPQTAELAPEGVDR